MKIQRLLFAIALASSMFVVGCGPTQGEKIPAKASPVLDQVKSMLQSASENGQPLGSGGMIFSEYLVGVEKTDAAKAKALQAEFDSLMSASAGADIKAKAAALLKKL